MTQKIPCPECAELNYESSPACWKCGTSLRPKPSAPPVEPPPPPVAPELAAVPEPQIVPEQSVPPAPPAAAQPPPTSTESLESPEPATVHQPSAVSPQPSPKPAEIEAASLKEKDFVTPPVDVEDKPSTPGEWVAYAWAAIASSRSTFREALDDYDTRRGHKSGGVSSYGCVMTIIVITVILAVGSFVMPLLMPHSP